MGLHREVKVKRSTNTAGAKSRKSSPARTANQPVRSPRKASEPTSSKSSARSKTHQPDDRPARFPIVGIGASAGGLEAFTQLLKHLPMDTGMGFVLVQHLDPVHESALTQLLTRVTSLPVSEVAHNQRVGPNEVYIIPPNTNLSIERGVLKLQPREAGRGRHLSIDFFFESLARDQHECAIGVILSGTASDGTVGMEAIKAEGGITFAQDDSATHQRTGPDCEASVRHHQAGNLQRKGQGF